RRLADHTKVQVADSIGLQLARRTGRCPQLVDPRSGGNRLFLTAAPAASTARQLSSRQPNVNANASTPESRNSISNRRSEIGPGCRTSEYNHFLGSIPA